MSSGECRFTLDSALLQTSSSNSLRTGKSGHVLRNRRGTVSNGSENYSQKISCLKGNRVKSTIQVRIPVAGYSAKGIRHASRCPRLIDRPHPNWVTISPKP